MGRPAAFAFAAAIALAWLVSGPVVGYSDTWHLFIDTATTIVVLLIQSTWNRDAKAKRSPVRSAPA